MITGNTKLLCVVGYPARHSRSPAIHNAFAAEANADCVYLAFDVAPDGLAAFVDSVRTLGIAGFNVTMPHKETIIPLLDEVDEFARRCGAVNTVVNRNGYLCGYNTDGGGTLDALGGDVRGKTVLILGVGGAAKAASLALSDAGAEVYAFTRRDAAVDLPGAEVFQFSDIGKHAFVADIIINATPLGMDGHADFDSFAFLDGAKPDATVFDFVYQPEQTRLLAEAARRGLRTVGGLALLHAQAARSWRLFAEALTHT